MKLLDMALLAGTAYLLTRTASAQIGSGGIPVASGGTSSIAQTVKDILTTPPTSINAVSPAQIFVVPSDLNVPHTNAAGQYTGDTRGAYQLSTDAGLLTLFPYDPRQTLTNLSALADSLGRTATTAFQHGDKTTWAKYQGEFQQIRGIARAWQFSYNGVL